MQTFFGWRFVHLLLSRAEDNKAALPSDNTFHQRISALFENVPFCCPAAFWQLDSNLGPLTEKCWYSLLGTAVAIFSVSHYNQASTRRSPVPRYSSPQLFIMPMNVGRRLNWREQSAMGHPAGQWQSLDPDVPLAVPARERIADISIFKSL